MRLHLCNNVTTKNKFLLVGVDIILKLSRKNKKE